MVFLWDSIIKHILNRNMMNNRIQADVSMEHKRMKNAVSFVSLKLKPGTDRTYEFFETIGIS